MKRLSLLLSIVGFVFVVDCASVYARSNPPNTTNNVGKTNKNPVINTIFGPGCENCHGTSNSTFITTTIGGSKSLAANATGTYTLTVQFTSTIAHKVGIDVAAQDGVLTATDTSFSQLLGTSGEITHKATPAIRTLSGNQATYTFGYTMPAAATAASAHTLYAVAAVAFQGWKHAPDFKVYVPPNAPTSASTSSVASSSLQLNWTGGGPQYRVVYKTGATAPTSPTDPAATAIDAGTSTSTSITGLSPGTQYSFAVFSKVTGDTVYSATRAATTATTGIDVAPNPFVNASTGNDANAGTADSPLKTIKQALLNAGFGGTITVAPGTYGVANGEVFPLTMPSGRKLISTGGAATTIINAATANQRVIVLDGTSSTTLIQGFTIIGGRFQGVNPGTDTAGGGILISGADASTITRCIITGNEVFGYAGNGGSPAGAGGNGGGIATSVSSATTRITNNVITNNIAHGGNGYTNPAGNGGSGANATGGAIWSAAAIVVFNNTINGNMAIGGSGGAASGATGSGGVGGDGRYGAFEDSAPLANFSNNIISNNGGAGGAGGGNSGGGTAASGSYQIGAATFQTDTTNTGLNNLFFNNQLGNGSTGTSPVTGQNPLFLSPTDFHLRSASPARNAGTSNGAPTTDFDGNPRTMPPTIGAFEIGLFLNASGQIGQIRVSWPGVTGATSYNLYIRSTTGVSKSVFDQKITGATSPVVLSPLPNGTTRYFVLTAIESGVEGPASPEVSATVSAGTWARAQGTASIPFTDVVTDMTNGAVLYASANNAVGVYKSSDAGNSWVPLTGLINGRNVQAVGANAGTVYAVTKDGDILRSIDSGANWTLSLDGNDVGETVKSLAIDPLAPNTVYAGDIASGFSNLVVKTINGGANWTNLPSGSISAYEIEVDPLNSGTLYTAGTGTPNVAKSVDGGATGFSTVSPASGFAYALALAPTASQTLYCGMQAANGDSLGVYKTINGGVNWNLMNNGFGGTLPSIDSLFVDPNNSALVFAGTDAGYYSTSDGAANWAPGPSGGPFPSSTIFANAFAVTSSRRLFASSGNGLYMLALDAAPTLTGAGISPTSGSTAGGTNVTITGTNFRAGVSVLFDGVAATNVVVASPSSITATTPAHAAGPVNVTITNTDGQTVNTTFTYTSGCSYAISPTGASFSATGGTGSLSVLTSCAWSAGSNSSFITITSGFSGTGNGTVNYSVGQNLTGSQRTGTLTAGGQLFTVTQSAATTGSAAARGLLDFNGDGKGDILFRHNNTGEIWEWQMNGLAINAAGLVFTVGDANFPIVGTGDFNGDGKSDILFRHTVTGEIWIWLMNGLSINAANLVHTVGDANFKIVGVGDFNGDGRSDILFRHSVTGEIWIWMMNGFSIAAADLVFTVNNANFPIVGVGDFNNDGKSDILFRHTVTGEIWIWLMNGFSISQANLVFTVGDGNFKIVGVSDFSGEGRSDILFRHTLTGEIWIWLMNGFSISQANLVFTVGDVNFKIIGNNDFNGDTRADILFRHTNTGEVWEWQMNGTSISNAGLVYTIGDANFKIIAPN